MLEDTETADYSNPPKRKTRGRHTKTLRNCFFPLQGVQTDSLSMNWEGLSRRKLPFIFAYNHLAADKHVSSVHKRVDKIQNKYYSQNQNGKMAKSTYGS